MCGKLWDMFGLISMPWKPRLTVKNHAFGNAPPTGTTASCSKRLFYSSRGREYIFLKQYQTFQSISELSVIGEKNEVGLCVMTSVGVPAAISAPVGGSFKVGPMSPIAESVPSTPPSDHEVSKSVSESSEEVFESSGGSGPEKTSFQPVRSPPSEPDSTFRSWTVSPNKRTTTSPSVSPTPSRISSHGSSDTPDHVSSKVCATEPAAPLPFTDNRNSPESYRMSPAFASEHINPYLRLHSNPFQMAHGFLSHPFLSSANFGLISQQLHPSKMQTHDLLSMQREMPAVTMQQLQFLQNRLQCLPGTALPCSPVLPTKPIFPDSKGQLSLLIQARKTPKPSDSERSFRPLSTKSYQSLDILKSKDPRRSSVEESDSDELLSVGSESPPLSYATRGRRDTDNESDAGSSSLDCTSSLFSKSPFQPNKPRSSKIYPALGKSANKSGASGNRTLKFSIDNILKSDFGSENVPCVKKQKPEKKVEKDVVRTTNSPKETKKDEEKESTTPMDLTNEPTTGSTSGETPMLWPAWVYCTRYSDRPSSGRSKYGNRTMKSTPSGSGPRTRRPKSKDKNPEEKRPRTAFSGDQLSRLKHEFAENRYLTERRRQDLARELGLNEAQIKIWFQNKRAKMKKARGEKNPLALQLMAQGLYNHSTVPLTREEEEAAAAELSD